MTRLELTPSQTVGPFFSLGLPWPGGPRAVPEGTPGAIWLRGRVLDGAGDPVPDALIETWAPPSGAATDRHAFARCPTDDAGRYAVLLPRPGPIAGPAGTTQAPHVALSIFARGLLDRVVTRVYLPDEAEANAVDSILAAIADESVRSTLIAVDDGDGYVFDIRLQGEHETVFFSV
jgi:protocatechuate 3,4-dioxygenase alpha subunit